MQSIEEVVATRGIKTLFHFTRVENLEPILQHGLMLKTDVELADFVAIENDSDRHDHTDAVCTTISWPNYKMWHPLKENNPGTNWVLIALKASVLWERDCAFCKTNAASATVSCVPLDKRRTLAAFNGMFEDFEHTERAKLKIPDHYSTNPQAEVLVMNGVPVEYIKGVVFKSRILRDKYTAEYPELKTYLNGDYWYGRSDNKHWK